MPTFPPSDRTKSHSDWDYKQVRRREQGALMAHEIAKLLLEKAGTFLQRTQAIEAALQLGMPLHEIEEYLDWLDSVLGPPSPESDENGSSEDPPST